MGFLEAGTPLAWPESLEWVVYVRKHGIAQFLHTYNRVKGRTNDVLKWGDEIEYHLVKVDRESGECSIALVAPEVLEDLEAEDARTKFAILSAWRPEYGAWMVEATPGVPYGNSTLDLLTVERNMAMRRYRISRSRALPPGTVPVSIVNFPLLGAGQYFTYPPRAPGGPFSRSAYLPDAVISPHPRFGALTANIRRRRGCKVDIQVPLYRDRYSAVGTGQDGAPLPLAVTDQSAERSLSSGSLSPSTASALLSSGLTCAAVRRADEACAATDEGGDEVGADGVGPAYVAKPGFLHMDAMGFGMGCCCLQVTFQARDLHESRVLYDQLAVLAPLMLALTANVPVWRGRLVDTDTRWDIISASVDCRTPAERGASSSSTPSPAWMEQENAVNAAGKGQRVIHKSRYSSIDAYIAQHPCLDSSPSSESLYNDLTLEYDGPACTALEEAGVDPRLARHVAHLFIRDPLVIFAERTTSVDDSASTEHFENIQSTNWRSVRWKPPPPDAAPSTSIGWRVELRTMEAQMTDFENAAYTVFVVLLSRVLLFFDLSLYLPLSLVEVNFERANSRKAVLRQKFWFRRRLQPLPKHCEPCKAGATAGGAVDSSGAPLWAEMSLAEILLGRRSYEAGTGCDAGLKAAAEGHPPPFSPPPHPPTPAPAPGSGLGYDPCGCGGGGTTTPPTAPSGSALRDADFPGLVPLIFVYLDFIECDAATRSAVDGYMRFICGRARGDIMTGATWQRAFVRSHPAYAQDGVVSPRIATDLLARIDDIATGRVSAPELLGTHAPPPIVFTGAEPEVAAGQEGKGMGAGATPSHALHAHVQSPLPTVAESLALSVTARLREGEEHSSPSLSSSEGPRMRGSSFSDDITHAAYACGTIRDLVHSHAARLGLSVGEDGEIGDGVSLGARASFSFASSPLLSALHHQGAGERSGAGAEGRGVGLPASSIEELTLSHAGAT